MHITLERPEQPEIVALIVELDAYLAALYPPESNHGIDIAALARPNVLFAVARGPQGFALGCGAMVLGDGVGELKRMYVRPQGRGHGVGKAVLAFLEAEAVRRGCRTVRLETGISQPEALGLYARAGYVRCGPFADYTDDPLSLFMQKTVGGSGNVD
jgi:putative acetyltransferase